MTSSVTAPVSTSLYRQYMVKFDVLYASDGDVESLKVVDVRLPWQGRPPISQKSVSFETMQTRIIFWRPILAKDELDAFQKALTDGPVVARLSRGQY